MWNEVSISASLLVLLSRTVQGNLIEPTLVGIGQCEPIPQIRLPLYWAQRYSVDGKVHTGPKDISTIISLPGEDESILNDQTEKTVAKNPPTPATAGNNNLGNGGTAKGGQTTPKAPPVAAPKPVTKATPKATPTGKKNAPKTNNKGGKGVRKLRYLEPSDTLGIIDKDGTTRATIEEVSRGARLVIMVFYYADLRQCAVLATDLSSLVDEVNAELLAASDSKDVAPQVSAVILNNQWPLTCDQYDTKCPVDDPKLTLNQWQKRIMNAAPKLPILQDVATVNAWDTVFGTFYTDVVVYLDGRLYQYYPSALAASHSQLVASKVDKDQGLILNNWKKFKQDLLAAAQIPFQWCVDDNEYPKSEELSQILENKISQQKFLGNAGLPFYDQAPLAEPLRGDPIAEMEAEDYFDFLLGFIFAAVGVGVTLVLCLIWRCCVRCADYCCCDLPIHTHRRMKMENDGLGEFRPLTNSTVDADDDSDVFDDDVRVYFKNEEYWSDDEDEYSHYHEQLRDQKRDKDQDVDSEYGVSEDANHDFFAAQHQEETSALARLKNPQKVAEDFFRRQEEVELEMRAFRQEAEMERKLQQQQAAEDDALSKNSANSSVKSVKNHVTSLLADDDDENDEADSVPLIDSGIVLSDAYPEEDGMAVLLDLHDTKEDESTSRASSRNTREQTHQEEAENEGEEDEENQETEEEDEEGAEGDYEEYDDDDESQTSGLDLELLEKTIAKSIEKEQKR